MTTTTVTIDDIDLLPVASENKIEKKDETKFFAVVFVGDILTLAQKTTNLKRLGGRLFLDSHCLRNKLVPRCAITPLEEGMMKVHAAMVDEKKRDEYISEYVKTNTPVWDPVRMRKVLADVVVGNRPENRDILYKRVPAAREIGQIAQQGVVVVPSITNVEAIRDAQYHYFPTWNRKVQGLEVFPTRLAELEDYIRGRMSQARTEDLQAVGAAYLRSAQEFRLWGIEYVKTQTAAIKKAEGTAGYQAYDEIGERLFDMLDITREDKLVVDLARRAQDSQVQTGSIGTALTMLAELLQRGQQPNAERVPVPPALTELQPEVQTATPLEDILLQPRDLNTTNTPISNLTVSELSAVGEDFDESLPVASSIGDTVAGKPEQGTEEKILPPQGLGSDIEVETEE